jgi:CubicO group peptidase (beta-lactamase class C family)
MRRTFGIGLLLLAIMVHTSDGQAQPRSDDGTLHAILQPYLAHFNLPALAGAVVKDGKVVAAGAVGTRRIGTESPVSLADRFHIGSNTKAMTSLLAAMLVESGKLRWTSTVAEVFPELVGSAAPDIQNITLEQLLSHTSGIPSDTDQHEKLIQRSFAQEKRNLDELRYGIVLELVKQPLSSAPGKQFAYANMGYLLAGAMLERVSGRTWEELIAEHAFDRLGLKTAGFGPQARLGRVDAPLGHAPREGQSPKPILAGPVAIIRKSSGPRAPCTCRCWISRLGLFGTPAVARAGQTSSAPKSCESSTRA